MQSTTIQDTHSAWDHTDQLTVAPRILKITQPMECCIAGVPSGRLPGLSSVLHTVLARELYTATGQSLPPDIIQHTRHADTACRMSPCTPATIPPLHLKFHTVKLPSRAACPRA